MSRLTLALDVMGGDEGPRITIPASLKALEQDPMLSLLLFGDRQQIHPFLKNLSSSISKRLTICHCTSFIKNNQNVTYALRHSKGSSMRLALEAVQKGNADACISAGNTGALFGLSKILLQPLAGIERPALISIVPTTNQQYTVMLDLGANIECSSQNLYQFAKMGSVFAEFYLDKVFPQVGLLNVGIEEIKGTQTVRDAAELIKKDTSLNYIGFIEGNEILNGRADVIVHDGFVGNVALKTVEGSIKSFVTLLKNNNNAKTKSNNILINILNNLKKQFLKKCLLRPILQPLQTINPEQYNGASFIGLQSVVVKSHGNASSEGFLHAIKAASKQARLNIPQKILAGLEKSPN